MSTAAAIQAHITYDLIEDINHQVVIIGFASHDIASPTHARELGEQLDSLIRPRSLQYFVIDFAAVRSLGNTAFSELVSFVRKAMPVWVCNLDETLRLGASLSGLDDCVTFVANRHVAIKQAERTARGADDETVDYPGLAG
jgi:anti-anti-sigma regulatory factor